MILEVGETHTLRANTALTIAASTRGMNLYKLTAEPPTIEKVGDDHVVSWGEHLVVRVLASGQVGQFYSARCYNRAAVESAVKRWISPQRPYLR